LVQDKNEPILGFAKKSETETLPMDESSLKAPIQMASTLVPSFEKNHGDSN